MDPREGKGISMNNQNASEALADKSVFEFRLTIIDSRTLLERLMNEVSFLAYRTRQVWPEFTRNPIGFALRLGLVCKERIQFTVEAKQIGGNSGGSIDNVGRTTFGFSRKDSSTSGSIREC
jgi:hypothetical protein